MLPAYHALGSPPPNNPRPPLRPTMPKASEPAVPSASKPVSAAGC